MAIQKNVLRVADLPQKKPTQFDIQPEAAQLDQITDQLELSALRKVRFKGVVAPIGQRDWELTAHLGATVVQPCVVTLAPVTTRIEEDISRLYLRELPEISEGSEIEMNTDDTVEALPATLNLDDILIEALALALPLYPKADDAALTQAAFTKPGEKAMTDDDARPFAGLASLRDKLNKDSDGSA
ncbi:YceD family protein [Parasulfitobacter algicola]|uniref:DUF177 domain-containing protein n=1 Tax=Parasulfitobacter algicola TaxID=2614809 RepID=A0ABX2IQM4_9RHOB|nr:DUF177 domain-containing protein [Sulfitobacter algicola]NSX55174.1 DUF177 domain-containing protein [Sulfitobacter algicola]